MALFEHGGDIYAGHPIKLDFSVNTNPLGMPEAVKGALISEVGSYERYPDPHCRSLRAAISEREGVPERWILCGNGAADLIFRLCMAAKPKRALLCAPTFSEYEKAVRLSGGSVRYHRLRAAENFDLTGRILTGIKPYMDIVFICNPNNPTGRLADAGLLREAAGRCAETQSLLVVDECFLGFTNGESMKGELENSKHVVILRAFTKTFAMAGLRLGYMLSSDEALLERARDFAQHWSVSVPAQAAGQAALSVSGWMEDTRALVKGERDYLTRELRSLGLMVFESDANYLLIKGPEGLFESLLSEGILVRSCANFEGLDATYIRVGVKKREMNEELIKALGRAVNG